MIKHLCYVVGILFFTQNIYGQIYSLSPLVHLDTLDFSLESSYKTSSDLNWILCNTDQRTVVSISKSRFDNQDFDSYLELSYSSDDFVNIQKGFVLTFRHQYLIDQHTGAYITISFDGGEKWYNITDHIPDYSFPVPEHNHVALYSKSDKLFNGEAGFKGSSEGWIETSFQFGSIDKIKHIDEIMVRFNFSAYGTSLHDSEWMIDYVVLSDADISGILAEKEMNGTFSVFPNPASDVINIITEDLRRPLEVEIYSILGEKVLEHIIMIPIESIDVSALQEGNYIIRLNTFGMVYSKRLVIKK